MLKKSSELALVALVAASVNFGTSEAATLRMEAYNSFLTADPAIPSIIDYAEWRFSGRMADTAVDLDPAIDRGLFEFSAADIAGSSFFIGSTEVALRLPTPGQASHLIVRKDGFSGTLFLDVKDPIFTPGLVEASVRFYSGTVGLTSNPDVLASFGRELCSFCTTTFDAGSGWRFIADNGAVSGFGMGVPTAVDLTPVPIPASIWLGFAGPLGLLALRKRRRAAVTTVNTSA